MTYHGVRLSRASLAISEEAAMIALPGIVKNLFSQTVIDLSLIRVLGPSWDIIAIWISIESIMRPETVIKSEILGIIVIIVYNRSWPIL